MTCRVIFILTMALTTAPGCTNAPHALRMSVAPTTEQFPVGEDIHLLATLTAARDRVALGRASQFRARLVHDETRRRYRSDAPVLCGCPSAVLWPIAYPLMKLDLADVGGRYRIIAPGRSESIQVSVVLPEAGDMWVSETDADPHGGVENHLPPGTYRADVELRCSSPPPPLFWIPYTHTLTATCEFSIVEQTARRQDGRIARPNQE